MMATLSGYRPAAGDIVYDHRVTRLYGYVVLGAQTADHVTVALPTGDAGAHELCAVPMSDLAYVGPGFTPLIVAALTDNDGEGITS
jgi:hypothetical protein